MVLYGITDRMNGIYYRGFNEEEVADFESKLKRIVSNLEEEENK